MDQAFDLLGTEVSQNTSSSSTSVIIANHLDMLIGLAQHENTVDSFPILCKYLNKLKALISIYHNDTSMIVNQVNF